MLLRLNILFLCFIFSMNSSFSALTVTLHDGVDADIYYSSSASKLLLEDGDGSSRDKAYKLYIPVKNTVNEDFIQFPDKLTLPQITDVASLLNIPMNFGIDTNSVVIYIAMELTETSYEIIDNIGTISADVSNNVISLSLKNDICIKNQDNCNLLALPAASASNKMFYIYTREGAVISNGNSFNPQTDNTNGVYLNLYLSNVHRDNSEIGLKITHLRRGDETLKLEYSAILTYDTTNELVVIKKGNALTTADNYQTLLAAGATFLNEEGEYPATKGATIQVSKLTNGVEYNLGVAFKDKYRFISLIPESRKGKPIEIDKFIKSQQCYLLSAGFGEEHFIIDFFKVVRDDYLSKVAVGRAFTSFYYSTAPSYTKIIYSSEAISLIVRISAYILYFTIKYSLFILMFLLVLFSLKGILLSRVRSKSLTK